VPGAASAAITADTAEGCAALLLLLLLLLVMFLCQGRPPHAAKAHAGPHLSVFPAANIASLWVLVLLDFRRGMLVITWADS
jgi:hypothetical protein